MNNVYYKGEKRFVFQIEQILLFRFGHLNATSKIISIIIENAFSLLRVQQVAYKMFQVLAQ